MLAKEQAKELFDRIPNGSKNPLVVENSNTYFRALVAKANENGDCIINVDRGYYRPIPGEDDEEAEHYFARELHRARAILYKRKKMKEAYADRAVDAVWNSNREIRYEL